MGIMFYPFCEYLFRRFKSGEFDADDKKSEERPEACEDAELEALNEDLCQSLGVFQ